jgi:hypothetical protein
MLLHIIGKYLVVIFLIGVVILVFLLPSGRQAAAAGGAAAAAAAGGVTGAGAGGGVAAGAGGGVAAAAAAGGVAAAAVVVNHHWLAKHIPPYCLSNQLSVLGGVSGQVVEAPVGWGTQRSGCRFVLDSMVTVLCSLSIGLVYVSTTHVNKRRILGGLYCQLCV